MSKNCRTCVKDDCCNKNILKVSVTFTKSKTDDLKCEILTSFTNPDGILYDTFGKISVCIPDKIDLGIKQTVLNRVYYNEDGFDIIVSSKFPVTNIVLTKLFHYWVNKTILNGRYNMDIRKHPCDAMTFVPQTRYKAYSYMKTMNEINAYYNAFFKELYK